VEYYESGSIFRNIYYINDKFHREEGPALVEYSKDGIIINEAYFRNGVFIKG
jgi:antitoxin component YwqK of YwqJK toxin-antitoxin module